MNENGAPMILIATKELIPSKPSERWFRLSDYADGDELFDAIEGWLATLGRPTRMNESTVRFAQYRNMPSFGPAPRRVWIADSIAALHAGADPDGLMAYVECGGDPVDFNRCYIGWFESRAEFAAHHLQRRVLSAEEFDQLRAFVGLEAVAESLTGTHFEVYGHYFRLRA